MKMKMKINEVGLYQLLFIFNCDKPVALKRLKVYKNIIRSNGSWCFHDGKLSLAVSRYYKYGLGKPSCLEFRERPGLPYPIKRMKIAFKNGLRIDLLYLDATTMVLEYLQKELKYDAKVLRTVLTKIELPRWKLIKK